MNAPLATPNVAPTYPLRTASYPDEIAELRFIAAAARHRGCDAYLLGGSAVNFLVASSCGSRSLSLRDVWNADLHDIDILLRGSTGAETMDDLRFVHATARETCGRDWKIDVAGHTTSQSLDLPAFGEFAWRAKPKDSTAFVLVALQAGAGPRVSDLSGDASFPHAKHVLRGELDFVMGDPERAAPFRWSEAILRAVVKSARYKLRWAPGAKQRLRMAALRARAEPELDDPARTEMERLMQSLKLGSCGLGDAVEVLFDLAVSYP